MPEPCYIMFISLSLSIRNTRKVIEEEQIQRTLEAQSHLETTAVNSRLPKQGEKNNALTLR